MMKNKKSEMLSKGGLVGMKTKELAIGGGPEKLDKELSYMSDS